ncbi:hypothetical protein [uncultured Microbacterium sp.]|uniref:hypothetical protein n=1 Tax=uncultured Microbacterium sp. TaxID=191216 RepID=UPI0028DC2D37|nr:hypothetical protein [uncultured Microbacterium sp.]
MRSFYRDIATRLRPAISTSAHGVGKPTWTAPDELPLTRLRIIAVSGTEDDGTTEVTHRLHGPADIDLDAGDRVRWTDPRGRALTLDVVGVPLVYRGVTGSVAHAQVLLKARSV